MPSPFQFPPPRGGEQVYNVSTVKETISIPAPARGRTRCAVPVSLAAHFNSRPREGANISDSDVEAGSKLFQFPPPRGGEQRWNVSALEPGDFNSRPREGANIFRAVHGTHPTVISIPAPARGRTQVSRSFDLRSLISIPAPARGRTVPSCDTFLGVNFNSRPREGAN